jgi:hypothetical protein
MYYLIVDVASLKNPTILNNFHQIRVTVQYEPESPTSKYHYIFLLETDKNDVKFTIEKIQNEMFPSWYTFAWSESTLYIIFNTKHFQVDLSLGWSTKEYLEAQEFGRSQDIPEIYLDFKKDFLNYRNIADKLAQKTRL